MIDVEKQSVVKVNKLTQIQAIILVISESKRTDLGLNEILVEIGKRFPMYKKLKIQYHENKIEQDKNNKRLKTAESQLKDEIRRSITTNSGLFINNINNGAFTLSPKGERGVLKIQKLLLIDSSLTPRLSRKQGIVMSTYKNRIFNNSGYYYGKTKKDIVGVSPKDVSPKDVSPKDVSPKDVTPKDVTPKDVSPKDVSPKDVTPKVLIKKRRPRITKNCDDVIILEEKIIFEKKPQTFIKIDEKIIPTSKTKELDDVYMINDFLKKLPSLLDIDNYITSKSKIILNNLKIAILEKYSGEIDVKIDDEKTDNKLKQILKLNFKKLNSKWVDYLVVERSFPELFPANIYAYNDLKFIDVANNDEELFVIISCILEDDNTKMFIYNLK